MKTIKEKVVLFLLLTIMTGGIYPLAVTGIGRLFFPRQATGSAIELDGRCVGSELIGQQFTSPGYFWSRPSATVPTPYNSAASSGSNMGPLNPALYTAVGERIAALRSADSTQTAPVPVDLVTTSGSGLDPDITPAAAEYQIHRVAAARGISVDAVRALVAACTQGRQFGVLGEARVNVVKLNPALDKLDPDYRRSHNRAG